MKKFECVCGSKVLHSRVDIHLKGSTHLKYFKIKRQREEWEKGYNENIRKDGFPNVTIYDELLSLYNHNRFRKRRMTFDDYDEFNIALETYIKYKDMPDNPFIKYKTRPCKTLTPEQLINYYRYNSIKYLYLELDRRDNLLYKINQ